MIFDDTTKTYRFSTKLKPDQVQRNFSFVVRANDAVSEEFKIEVLPPPELAPLDGLPSPQLQLHYPRYTGLRSPQAVTPGSGNVEAVAGTAVTLRAKANRPLRAAWLEFQPDDRNVTLGAILAPVGARHPLASAALTVAGQEVWGRVPAVLDSDASCFSVEFLPVIHGNYVLHFEDDTGLRNSRTFELRLRSDPAPVVQLERPSAARDILRVLPEAELPLHVLAEDSIFAVRSVFLSYRTVRADPPRTILLYEQRTFARNDVAPMTGPSVLAERDLKPRPTNLEFQRTLSLKTIQHLNGWPLREGDVVILQAGADDFDDVAWNKPPGLSHEVEIHIVGRNALEIELNHEQAKVQQDLLRLREKEREALKQVTDVENKLKRSDALTDDDFAKLLQAEQTQQQMHERVGTEKEGLRADVARILQTLKQNQLQNSAVKERMQDVLRELNRIAEKELDPIEQRLAQARRQAELNADKQRSQPPEPKQAKDLLEQANAAAKEAAQKLAQALRDEAAGGSLAKGRRREGTSRRRGEQAQARSGGVAEEGGTVETAGRRVRAEDARTARRSPPASGGSRTDTE